MIRIALCDDETKVLDEVSEQIEKYARKKQLSHLEVCRFSSAKALESALDDGTLFSIFVLDVYIGDELGTALARTLRLRGIESPVVFLTASLEHAPQSFETDTLRYLLKPLDPKKFHEALDAALLRAEKEEERSLKFKTENGLERVNANHILYTEARAHYQHIALEDGRQLRVRMTVSELYTALAKYDGFVRVGSAYIINLRSVRNVSTAEVHLYNNITVPIPRGKHTEIKKAFWDFQCEGQGGKQTW